MWFVSLLVILCAKGFVSLAKQSGVPFIQPFTFPSDVIKGQSVTVTCAVADGSGTFDFRWAKDGQPLTDQPLTRIQTFEEYSLLFLKAVDSARSGNYTCFVINTGGSANHTAQLVVFVNWFFGYFQKSNNCTRKKLDWENNHAFRFN
ncbi:unnamed protein product [Larinioides sclopetarius]|uniref:Ig-like domain-containing protein n=1 Tax=Larinioides sclopetarius TaxID=280406 RepID=A0AAV1ZFV4_9ARAC